VGIGCEGAENNEDEAPTNARTLGAYPEFHFCRNASADWETLSSPNVWKPYLLTALTCIPFIRTLELSTDSRVPDEGNLRRRQAQPLRWGGT
jgi:hypothetical protein